MGLDVGSGFDRCLSRRLAPLATVALCLALANCASSQKFARKVDPKYGVAASPRVVDFGEPVPKGGGTYRVGKPYVVAGRMYVPEENPDFRQEGLASWYGDDFHGRLTANGEVFDMGGISAAHPTLPMPSYARVTNLGNKRSIIVRINDRGPYHSNRVIDLSHQAANLLGFTGNGVARVRVEYVGRAPLEGSDDRTLMATLREGQPAPAPSSVMLASAKPFLSNNGVSGAISDTMPLPPDRPYNLGEGGGASVPSYDRQTITDLAAAAHAPRVARFDLRAEGPVSAYASTRYDGATAFNGRGLY
jgi:rare lipoprotein A